MKKVFITLLAAGLLSTAGQAQTPWTGFKLGATLGSTQHEAVWTDTDYDWYGGNLSHSKRVITPSIHGGYDYQTGSIVYGVEADFTRVGADHEVGYESAYVLKRDNLKYMFTLRGRMGLAVGNALVFTTMGLARAKADHTWIETGDEADSWPTFSNSHTGFVYGFGVEHRVNKAFSVRAEYQHVDLPAATSVNQYGYRMEVRDIASTFRVGATYHF